MNTLINIQILKETISGDFKIINNDIDNEFKNYLYIEAKTDFLYIKQNQNNFQIEFKIPADVKKIGFFIIKTDVFNTLINTSSGEEILIKTEKNIIYFETKTNKTEIKNIKTEKYPNTLIEFNKQNSLKINIIICLIKTISFFLEFTKHIFFYNVKKTNTNFSYNVFIIYIFFVFYIRFY